MRIIICDKDQDSCSELHSYIEEYFQRRGYADIEIVTYNNGIELLNDAGDMGIVFLSVELPGENGIQIGRALKKRDKHMLIIIMEKSYDYIDDAMRIHVFRYLTKPINKQRLFRNMQDAMYQYSVKDRRILIESGENLYSVRMSDIICVQMALSGEETEIHTINGSYRTSQTLTYWEERLNSKAFFRPHRSNIVNMEYVSQFNREEIKLYHDQFTTYMARRQFTQFKKIYLFFLESNRQ